MDLDRKKPGRAAARTPVFRARVQKFSKIGRKAILGYAYFRKCNLGALSRQKRAVVKKL